MLQLTNSHFHHLSVSYLQPPVWTLLYRSAVSVFRIEFRFLLFPTFINYVLLVPMVPCIRIEEAELVVFNQGSATISTLNVCMMLLPSINYQKF
ncbi:hypothetical protein Tsubulata_029041 [Turnera subulata]|uniref:Uncharacterized protein n=1 Tax=Turnera subulata TaxID=218843 RepID=A0A9Q0GHB9_9ROSI|nr:hypothetical protein Tsubulata_029041 [Turnera subulata]